MNSLRCLKVKYMSKGNGQKVSGMVDDRLRPRIHETRSFTIQNEINYKSKGSKRINSRNRRANNPNEYEELA